MSIRSRRRERHASDVHPAHRKVALLAAVLLAMTALVGVAGAISVRSSQGSLHALLEDDGRILTEMQAIQQVVLRGQLATEQAATTPEPERKERLRDVDALVTTAIQQWERTSTDPDAPAMATTAATFAAWSGAISDFESRLSTSAATADPSEVREAFTALMASLGDDITPLAADVTDEAQDALDRSDLARRALIAVVVFGLGVGLLVSRSTYRAARAQHDEIARSDRQRAAEAARAKLQAQVAQALEFAGTDTEALHAAEIALRQLQPDRPTELLLADSSRAHFEVGLRSSSNGLPGCRVPTPRLCPAVAKGHTLVFHDSEEFDACPYLRERETGPQSAICIPVSISGTAEGVLHSIGPNAQPIDAVVRHTLEYVAARAGDRIGVLRAFNRSEAQAATDPLTGLNNRRSFEDHVGGILRNGANVTIAFGDIDLFKKLNDAHGHDAGDRALRTFARTFRNAVRPGDLIARWGGEEFVAAFPDTGSEAVVGILERLQRQLAALVTSGVIPPFTVSFGVADQYDGDDLEALVMAADRALLGAKRAGRDRIVLASDAGPAAPTPTTLVALGGPPA